MMHVQNAATEEGLEGGKLSEEWGLGEASSNWEGRVKGHLSLICRVFFVFLMKHQLMYLLGN